MPNFIIPVVGNPAGGYSDGDQVTAANLNAHIQEAVPSGEFISGRSESIEELASDYYLKVDEYGNILKVGPNYVGTIPFNIDTNSIKTEAITSRVDTSLAIVGDSNLYLSSSTNIGIIVNSWINLTPVSIDIGTYHSNITINGGEGGSTVYPDAKLSINRNVEITPYNGTFKHNGVSALHYIPCGTTAQRPTPPGGSTSVTGVIRCNSETKDLEWFDTSVDGNWNSVKKISGEGAEKAINGWVKLPNGIIMQWGTTITAVGTYGASQVTFPIPFPGACLNVSLTQKTTNSVYNASGHSYENSIKLNGDPTKTGFGFSVHYSGSQGTGSYQSWLAIGY